MDRRRAAAWALNVALRLAIVGYAREALGARDDPRFAGKGIPIRNLILAGAGLTLTFPLLHAWRRPWDRYPVGTDAAFLSILALDMAGNSLDLYERGWRFDLIPHSYGPFVGVATLRSLGLDPVRSALIVNAVHALLEAQEALADAVFGTHNVHGWWDTISDLGAGLLGSVAIPLAARRLLAARVPLRHRSRVPAYSGV